MEERGNSACFCFEHPGLFQILFNKVSVKKTRPCESATWQTITHVFSTRKRALYCLHRGGGGGGGP